MRADLDTMKKGLTGHLSIAVIPTALPMVSRLTTAFTERWPEVGMAVFSRNSTEALRLLEEGTRPEDIAAARANLQASESSLASAQTSLKDATLVAPADGVILSRVREPGAIVSPSDIVYVLSLANPVWVRAYIAEPNLGRIHTGMRVQVFTDSAPDKPYSGTIGFISPVAEFTPKSVETPELRTDLVYRLRIVIDQGSNGLRQGMPVTVRIPLGKDDAGGS